ncbi:hypothetical protein C4D60_Mb03t03590 [Musa balbisiana]|uniref:Uncharacterized protein n=1 Tax=Musa balbisiana TaxID=52838 RepID=A0A4S8J908_MUSBA|nr:hypothetical protein C4D60_Mb03t03590 [Musa balbisiana]
MATAHGGTPIIAHICSNEVDDGFVHRSEVEGHLDGLLCEPALLVERPQIGRAIEDDLVAASGLGVVRKVTNHPLPKAAAAGGGVDDDVLDVADLAATVEELALNKDAAGSDDPAGVAVLGDDDEVVVTEGGEVSEAGAEVRVGEGGGGRAQLR